jgi:hypothetical protein
MASKGNWTIVFDDKLIINQDTSGKKDYVIDDDTFWNQSKFSNIWAIHYGTSVTSDEVEYRDETPHSSFADANIGDISQFTEKWHSHVLSVEQANWDNDPREESEKGPRPS